VENSKNQPILVDFLMQKASITQAVGLTKPKKTAKVPRYL
jgi:hypothetical protein